jgi:hypothetical protein
MSKYENFVFLTICEIAMSRFKESNYLTFINYCRNMAVSLKRGDLDIKQLVDFYLIVERLDLIYSMSPEETGKYISDFFNSERILLFEKYVTINQQINPPLV